MQDNDNLLLKNYHIRSAIFLKYNAGQLTGSAVKNFSQEEIDKLNKEFDLQENDLLILVENNEDYTNLSMALGAIRKEYAERLNLVDDNVYKPLFVIDWPIFGRENGEIVSLSNPFTRPRDEDLHYLDTDPTKALSYAYDTVINGIELSSGSLRIYDSKVQQKIFEILGFTDEDIEKKFGFFIDALKFGTPPHGGFAFGLDRLSMILCHTDNIHDVIAFPKNLQACCPMSSAPSIVPEEALKILHIKVEDENE